MLSLKQPFILTCDVTSYILLVPSESTVGLRDPTGRQMVCPAFRMSLLPLEPNGHCMDGATQTWVICFDWWCYDPPRGRAAARGIWHSRLGSKTFILLRIIMGDRSISETILPGTDFPSRTIDLGLFFFSGEALIRLQSMKRLPLR